MSTKTIPIAEVTKGMFVVSLDIPWDDTPFFNHSRKIYDSGDILLLKKAGVKELVIDLERSAGGEAIDAAIPEEALQPPESYNPALGGGGYFQAALTGIPSGDSSEYAVQIENEMRPAKALKTKVSKIANQLGSMIRQGRPPQRDEVEQIIEDTRESLARNDQALVTLLHLRREDKKLEQHAFGVFALVLALATRMRCSDEEINELGLAALLHDSGWSHLPAYLFTKSSSFSPSEWKLVKLHPEIAENILNKSEDFSATVKALVKQHQEIADGSGYPLGLGRAGLHPLLAILQVADYYDELIHGLAGSSALLPSIALKQLYQDSKKQRFDESIVIQLIHMMGIYPATSAVQLNTGEKALVLEANKSNPLFPKVVLVYNADGSARKAGRVIDLAKQGDDAEYVITGVLTPMDKNDDPKGLMQVLTA